ncbi:tubulin-specific chaperone E [Culicoides brevitarsis]|uniref:tubulin-specific chaperone E n=1 Tax=Culicoides brevitarsis TaxID=469753 RepID=UPI00307C186B
MVGLSNQISENENIHLDGRVKVQGFYGTIKYVGAVENHPGIWVGVEWDDVSRGKHDGVVKGIRYFQTSHPYSGTLVRLEKLLGDFQTLEEAIIDRYYEKDEIVLDESLIKEARQFMHAPLLEIVGMDKIRQKQSHLDELCDVSVAGAPINRCGDLTRFRQITNLDLSSTLISNWGVVMQVVEQLKNLQYLDLSNNRIRVPAEAEISEFASVANKVKGINLRNNGITNWHEVLKIAKLWPNIEFLSLQDNSVGKIEKFTKENVFQKLEKLDLQGNKLENFENIVNLGHLKQLKELLLSNNNFTEVKMPDCNYQQKLDIFVALQKINLRDNFIKDDIACFNELDKLASLENLSYSTSTGERYEDWSYKAIALITGLKVLNKRRIEDSDRRNAEIDTWKLLFEKWFELSDDEIGREKFLNKFRAYPKLLLKYGTPEMHIVGAGAKKKSGTYKILLEHLGSGKRIERKLPSKMSIQALYGLISKLFAGVLDGNDFGLEAVDPRCENIRVPLDPSSKTIDYYSIKEGDTILIH